MEPAVVLTPITAQKRPRSVTILGWLQILQSLGLLVYAVFRIVYGVEQTPSSEIAWQFIPLAWFHRLNGGPAPVVAALVALFISIALLRMQPWAWMASVCVQGMGLLAALVDYAAHQPDYAGMLYGVVLVFYLNQQEVQAAFRAHRSQP